MKVLKGIDGKLDNICRALCKERADWTCEKCKREFPERRGSGLHWSHFFGRRARSTRWNIFNCAAHCHGCHAYLGSNPAIFTDWQKEYLGVEQYEKLMQSFHKPMKLSKSDKQEMYEHYFNEMDRLLQLRRVKGVTGYIEVVNYF